MSSVGTQRAPTGRARASARSSAGAARRAPRSGRGAPTGRRSRRPRASPAARRAVLPEPTSPCTSRFIGTGRPRSSAISAPTARWSPVSANGSDASKRSSSAAGRRMPRGRRVRPQLGAPLRAARPAARTPPWNRSVRRAAFQSASTSGRWISSSARRCASSARDSRTRLGHRVVDRGRARRAASAIAFASCQLASVPVAG